MKWVAGTAPYIPSDKYVSQGRVKRPGNASLAFGSPVLLAGPAVCQMLFVSGAWEPRVLTKPGWPGGMGCGGAG